jgi:RNA polymerase primary sigma factor
MIETINKLIRTARSLVQEYGREPSPEEIAKKMGIPVMKVARSSRSPRSPSPRDAHRRGRGQSSQGFYRRPERRLPGRSSDSIGLRSQTQTVLKTLTPREEKVLKLRFGVGDGSEHTLEEVGQNFAVTRERIRQIESKALRKLRHPSRSKVLRVFLEKAGAP